MARYIEREKFLKKCAEAWGYAGVTIKAIEQIADECTTADVVPKSEVERWRRNLEAVLEERAETKAEVAREIFEEIEKFMDEDDGLSVFMTRTEFFELKKKYTEVEG